MIEKKELDLIIRDFYPVGVDYENDFVKYSRTSEYAKLEKTCTDFQSNGTVLSNKIEEINRILGCSFHSVMPGWMDRCLSFQMPLKSKNRKVINLDISALVASYTLSILEFDKAGKIHMSPPDEQLKLNLLNQFGKHIKKGFELKLFPQDLINSIVPEVSFECHLGDFTYYNAFFNNQPIIT